MYRWLAVLLAAAMILGACSSSSSESVESDGFDDVGSTEEAEQLACASSAAGLRAAEAIGVVGICTAPLLTAEQQVCAAAKATAYSELPRPESALPNPNVADLSIEPSDVEISGRFVPIDVLEAVASIAGVQRAHPLLLNFEGGISDGETALLFSSDAPVLQLNWDSRTMSMSDGVEPPRSGEFALSPLAASTAQLTVGTSYELFGASDVEEMMYVGEVASEFDEVQIVALTTDDALRIISGGAGYTSVNIWLDDPAGPIEAVVAAVAQWPELSVVRPADALAGNLTSMIEVVRNMSAFVGCMVPDARVGFASVLHGEVVSLETADCLLTLQAADPLNNDVFATIDSC